MYGLVCIMLNKILIINGLMVFQLMYFLHSAIIYNYKRRQVRMHDEEKMAGRQ